MLYNTYQKAYLDEVAESTTQFESGRYQVILWTFLVDHCNPNPIDILYESRTIIYMYHMVP